MADAVTEPGPDGDVGERLLGDVVALPAGLEPGLLHAVGLEDAVELGRVAS
jgi:hypothetical protein